MPVVEDKEDEPRPASIDRDDEPLKPGEKPGDEQQAGHEQHLRRWVSATRKISTLLSLSKVFRTLRDQYHENNIWPEELQTIERLGQGEVYTLIHLNDDSCPDYPEHYTDLHIS